MLDRVRSFLGKATPAQRCILVLTTEIPFLIAFLLAPSVGLVVPQLNKLLVPSVIIANDIVIALVIVIGLLQLRWLWPRRMRHQQLPNMSASIAILSAIGFGVTAVTGGNLTYPANLVIVCLVPCGLLMLDMRSTAYGLAAGLLIMMLSDLADFAGLWRYAPGYGPEAFVNGKQHFMAELLRTGILYVSVISYGVLIWVLFDQYDFHKRNLMVLSQIDVLTGLSNRRHFMEQLESECARLARTQGTFCLVMIDADHFKKINDAHGHLVGDEVLCSVANVLTQHMRVPGDLPARIGGEEFAILFPDTTLVSAQMVCELIRATLDCLVFQSNGRTFKVTLSMGIVETEGHDAESLLHYADANLYLAKAQGRNRIIATRLQREALHERADTVA